jgi:3-oxoacyl-[acyl-carrier protein] reductase
VTHEKSGKVGIVTGGAGGIGAAVCQRLAADGHHVVVAYLSAADAASQLVAQITAAGHSASAVRVDVSESDEVAALFADVRARYGRIDIVINNAGVIMLRRLAELTVEIYEHVFGVNVRGTLNVLRETAQHLSDNGRVVNTSSTLVGAPIAGSAAYVASKAALELLTPVAAQELGPRGITVNALRVGPTVPGMLAQPRPSARPPWPRRHRSNG